MDWKNPSLEETLTWMVEKHDLVKGEGYKCGHCAAYPCYRNPPNERSAGLCFQNVRQCRDECDNYVNKNGYPAGGGICKITKLEVEYCEECSVESMKVSKLLSDNHKNL